MTIHNPNLLIICTQYNEWTTSIYQPFGIYWDQPGRRKIKSISFEQILNDYEADYKAAARPDILIFDEAISPIVYKRSAVAIQEAMAAKESVYLVVHQQHIAEYKSWISTLAGTKWVSHQQKNSTEGSTVDLLKKLSGAFQQREPAAYAQLLTDYFLGRKVDDLEELQFQLLNSFDQKKFQELADRMIRQAPLSEQLHELFHQHPEVKELIHQLAGSTDPAVIGRIKLQMASLFFSGSGH